MILRPSASLFSLTPSFHNAFYWLTGESDSDLNWRSLWELGVYFICHWISLFLSRLYNCKRLLPILYRKMSDNICKQRAWQSICYMSVECFLLAVLKVLCWSNYVQQCIWMVFLASVVCVGLIIVGFGLFGQSWVVATGGHMCESTFGLGVAPASQGGRRSWAGRCGRWLWQDLEGNFPESRGQEDLGLRCSDWPATRPWWPRSACCCCWRIHLEHRRYIAYYRRTEMADWPSASPRCHYGNKNTNKSTNVRQVRRQKAISGMQGKVLRKSCMQRNTMPLQSIPLQWSANH